MNMKEWVAHLSEFKDIPSQYVEEADWRLPSAVIDDIVVIDDTIVHLALSDGRIISLYHQQDCCEDVYITDGLDELRALKGQVLSSIEVVTSDVDEVAKLDESDSATWTFVNIYTTRDHAQLRWYGSSNGYYSEEAGAYDTTRAFRNYVCTRRNDMIFAGVFGAKVAKLEWHGQSMTFKIVTGDGEILDYGTMAKRAELEEKFNKLKKACHEIFGQPNN